MAVLDRSRPLWEMWFVDGLEDGSVGLVYKVHHAVVDGVSASETFEILLAPGGDTGPPPKAGAPMAPVERAATGLAQGVRTVARWWTGVAGELLRDPKLTFGRLQGLTHLARPSAFKPASSLNRPVGPGRRLVSVGFDLADLKAIGRHNSATVNDVVLSLVAAGMTELLDARGEEVAHLQVLVPVSLRGEAEHGCGRQQGGGADGAAARRRP